MCVLTFAACQCGPTLPLFLFTTATCSVGPLRHKAHCLACTPSAFPCLDLKICVQLLKAQASKDAASHSVSQVMLQASAAGASAGIPTAFLCATPEEPEPVGAIVSDSNY